MQVQVVSSGLRLSSQDLEAMLGFGGETAEPNPYPLSHGREVFSVIPRLRFESREDAFKQAVVFPVTLAEEAPRAEARAEAVAEAPRQGGSLALPSIRLVTNLPLGVLILGQSSRPAFGGQARK